MQRPPSGNNTIVTRRTLLQTSTAIALGALGTSQYALIAAEAVNVEGLPHQATGMKIGEVTDSSAIVWVRLTQHAKRLPDNDEVLKPLQGNKDGTANADMLPGACPAGHGSVRLLFGQSDDFSDAQTTEWITVQPAQDGIHQFSLNSLPPDSIFYLRVECRNAKGENSSSIVTGKFRTAPDANENIAITSVILGCHLYEKRDHADGFTTYESVAKLKPHFIVQTGDNVYYDRDLGPFSTTIPLARWQWQRMFSLPRHRALLENVASYWEKDDHDLLKNDSWPGQTYGQLTYADGLTVFNHQTPSGPLPYRTFRWGKHLQIWLVEGRDYRSKNTDADGPNKTIWGSTQKAWLKKTLAESNASWKILISPTPIVGPDRAKKNDNHANEAFQQEGDEIRAWIKANVADHLIVVNGDRHWQYHSVHPQTGLHEFSAGPTSDGLAEGTPGEDKTYHRFHRVKGGFISLAANADKKIRTLAVRHHDINGTVVHEQVFTRS